VHVEPVMQGPRVSPWTESHIPHVEFRNQPDRNWYAAMIGFAKASEEEELEEEEEMEVIEWDDEGSFFHVTSQAERSGSWYWAVAGGHAGFVSRITEVRLL
jgi:hypothetical protein